jgi:hypothetical protein
VFCIYLNVLVPGQVHGSCVLLFEPLSKDQAVVSYDGLDMCLVMQVHDEFLAGCMGLYASYVTPCTKPSQKFIIASRCDIMTT